MATYTDEEIKVLTRDYSPQLVALCLHLDCDIDEIEECGYDPTYDTYEYGNEEYMVLSDKDADEAVKGTILDSVWAFNPDFLECHTIEGVTAEHIKCVQRSKYEDANEPLKAWISDIDHFVRDAVLSGGRGHFLSPYDGEEHTVKVNRKWYAIYRTN